MSKFSDFVKDENNGKERVENQPNTEDISKLIDKYSTYSQADLMDEFLKESERKKQNGELSDDDVIKLKTTLAPLLNDEQKSRLNDLLNMVK